MVYQWKQNRFDADPQKVGEELERIEYKDAISVVKYAQKTKGELHKCFEWDDTLAGQQFRMEQARLIMRMLVVEVNINLGGEPQMVKIRALESVRFADPDGEDEKNMTYVPTREALSDPTLRSQVMDRLEATIGQAQATAEAYAYLVPSLRATASKLKEARDSIRA